jgi:transmembrane sensor
VANLAKQPSWVPAILVGVGALVIALGGIWYVNRLGDEGAIGHALAAADARPHVSATAQMAIVSLDDGSKVMLAPESKLIVPKHFSDVMRVVKLDGAGTFTATPAGKRGLQIRAGNAAVTTTGTILTVRAYPEDDAVTVFVKEGTVTMKVGDSTYTIAAGKALRAEKSGQVHEPTPEQLEEAISWNDHTVTIANRQLRDVLPQLKRWYGLDIKVLDLPLLDRPVSIRATADSPREAITAVEKSADLKFGYMEKTMVFRDARPAAKVTKKRG